MKRLLIAATALIAMPIFGMVRCAAQSMDDLNLQVHGYATQGFIYSTNNNWNTTASTDGSAAWTEAVVNLTAQPQTRLRIGIQARYFLLGNYGNQITLDWAQADLKVNEKLGFRVGKVKTTAGQLNEYQDVDPALLWVLLPQGVYPISSREAVLAHYGGLVYGTIALGESFGKVDYRAYGGQRVIGPNEGYFQAYRDQGLIVPNGLAGPIFGGTLRWNTPLEGLMLGVSATSERPSGTVTAYSLPGNGTLAHLMPDHFFARYERSKVMVAGEYSRAAALATIKFVGLPPIYQAVDDRSFYAMSSYKLSNKLTGGVYYSSAIDRKAAFTSSRYQKDWAISSRYDFNPYLYLKLEQHVIGGTLRGYSTSDNAGGLKPNSRMTLLKLGVSF